MKTPQRIADVQQLLEKAAKHAKETNDSESFETCATAAHVLSWVLDYPAAEDSTNALIAGAKWAAMQ